jgi:hypothetical protein
MGGDVSMISCTIMSNYTRFPLGNAK